MDYIYVRQRTTDNGQQILSVNDVKELLKDWIKLYPNSFAPDVEFRIYQHEDSENDLYISEQMFIRILNIFVKCFVLVLFQIRKFIIINYYSEK